MNGSRSLDGSELLYFLACQVASGIGLNVENGLASFEVLAPVVLLFQVLLDHDRAIIKSGRAEVLKVGQLQSLADERNKRGCGDLTMPARKKIFDIPN